MTVNLPGITILVQDLLDALKAVAGERALEFIERKFHDDGKGDEGEETRKVVSGWAVRFDTDLATELGFGVVEGGVVDWVREFLEKEGGMEGG